MAVKFFGQFLLEKGAVSSEALLKAIELQESTNLKFGEVALQMGLLSAADVERVHNAQRLEDLRFGDMAVKIGVLTEEQMQQVLLRQKNSRTYIGEALVELGVLTPSLLEDYLEAFKTDQAPYLAGQALSIPAGVPLPQIWEATADLSEKMLTRIAGLSLRPGPCEKISSFPAGHVVASMELTGAANARYLLSVSESVQKAIAQAVLFEDNVDEEPQEVLEDTVMEFVNIVCGNVAAKVAKMGFAFDILPPEVLRSESGSIEVPEGHFGLLFPMHLAGGGKVDVAVFVEP